MAVIIILAKTISLLLSVITTAMFLRCICSFIPSLAETKFFLLLLAITEPVVLPVRFVMYKLNIGQNLPFDISFTVAYFILVIVEMLLPVI